MKLSKSRASARAALCSSTLDDEDRSRSAAEGLAEGLSRIVGDPARIDALHEVLGPFCHKSRNILNGVKISLYLAQRGDSPARSEAGIWSDVEERYRAVEGLLDQLQKIWRPMTPTLVAMTLSLLLEDRRRAWIAEFAAHARVLKMTAAGKEEAGEYDPHYLGLALDAFVAWRASAGEKGQEAVLRWWTRGGRFHVEWIEPRPPMKESTGSPRALDRPAPLALPYLGRVIAAHGGTMDLLEPAGSRLRLSWPQAAHHPH